MAQGVTIAPASVPMTQPVEVDDLRVGVYCRSRTTAAGGGSGSSGNAGLPQTEASAERGSLQLFRPAFRRALDGAGAPSRISLAGGTAPTSRCPRSGTSPP